METSNITTTSSRASEFPPTDKPSTHTPLKCPAPAGCTPNAPHITPFVPSPVECASPNSGHLFHPATPIPTASVFHNTPASPVPTFAVNDQPAGQAVNSPILCGPTPASTPVHPGILKHSPQPARMEFASETFDTPATSNNYTSTLPTTNTTIPTTTALPATTTALPATTTALPATTTIPTAATTTNPTTTSPTSAHAPHLSTLKGKFGSFVGKVTHNPDKQLAGNALIANRKEEKAKFFDQQATEWELKGNTNKALKNREKAARCRQMAQAKLQEPLASPVNKSSVKADKAAQLDLKAQDYERKGDQARAAKCHDKAYQLRQKYGLSQPIGTSPSPSIAVAPVF